MKLLELDIENFGIFSGSRLEFAPGFQLVYGENEAGKSTLLQLVRELLFGFPHHSPYAFDSHQGEMAASAGMELADGTRVRFRRRKGLKSTVSGHIEPDGESIGEAELFRMLDHASAELYRNVFGFALSELSSGEKSLAHANLNEALYGGGMGGLANVQRVQASLKTEHEGLFLPSKRATNPVINQLLRKIGEQRAELQGSILRPMDYKKLSETCARHEAQVAELWDSLEQMRRREAHCQRVSEALPPWLERAEAEAELATLHVPDGFPDDGADTFARNREQLHETDTELTSIQEELETTAQELGRIQLSPEIIGRDAEIKHLQQQIGRIQAFRREIPLRQQDAATTRDAVLAKLHELNPDWGLEQLEQFHTTLAQREQFESIRVELEQLQRRQSEIQAQRPALLSDVNAARRKLEQLEEVKAVPALEHLVQRQSHYETDREKLRELDERLHHLGVEVGTLRGKLDAPMNRSVSNAEKLSVPMEQTVQEHRDRFAEVGRLIAMQEQRVEEVRTQLADNLESIELLEAEDRVPDREELLAQRAHRDEGWQLIRRKYTRGKPDEQRIARWLASDEDSLADAYEREVARADQLADQRQAKAELVARREQLLTEVERTEQRVAEAERQMKERRKEQDDLTHHWNRLWAPCRLQPLSPEAMLDWLRQHSHLLEKLEQQSVLQTQRRDVEARLGDYEDELSDALPDMNDSPQRQLAVARQRVDAAREAAVERQTYRTQLPSKEEELERLEHELEEVRDKQRQWDERWQSTLADAGFPPQWDVRVATKILGGIGEARQQHQKLSSAERLAAEMQQQLDDYGRQVQQVCASIAPDLTEHPPEDAMLELGHRLDAANQAQRDQQKLTKDKAKLKKRLASKLSSREQLQQRRDQLMQSACAGSETEFHQVAATAARRRRLLTQIEAQTQKINTIRGTEDEKQFQEALRQADADTIAAQLRELSEQIATAASEYRQAVERAGIYRERMKQIDGRSEALRLQMELESSRSQLASAVDRWAPLVLAETLMKRAIDRFESEHQPEMLRETERLFSRMTRGRYVAIRRKLDEQGTFLIEQRDKAFKEPHQLSRGTREQLYLAIRLAYLHQYSQKAEPLPIVLDDILVNFDDGRAQSTLEVLWEVAESLQMIFLTCHRSVVDLMTSTRTDLEPIHLGADAAANAMAG